MSSLACAPGQTRWRDVSRRVAGESIGLRCGPTFKLRECMSGVGYRELDEWGLRRGGSRVAFGKLAFARRPPCSIDRHYNLKVMLDGQGCAGQGLLFSADNSHLFCVGSHLVPDTWRSRPPEVLVQGKGLAHWTRSSKRFSLNRKQKTYSP
jgi:hypothetical protein